MTSNMAAPTSFDDLAPKMRLKGVVKKIDLYGALVDVGVGRLGLLHISQISENHVKNVSDVLHEGDEVEVWVQEIDRQRGRVGLTMLKPPAVTWNDIAVNNVYRGTVVRVEKFGAFVDIGAERPGLVHVSELAAGYVGNPSDVVSLGDEIEVKVIEVNRRKKQIDLSVRALEEPVAVAVAQEQEEEDVPTAMELALRQALEGSGFRVPTREGKPKRRNKKSRRHEEREDIFLRTLQQHAKD
jgi:ribosomal protein S1